MSLPETSARLPAERYVDTPTSWRSAAALSIMPMAPDWLNSPSGPSRGTVGRMEALKRDSGAVL